MKKIMTLVFAFTAIVVSTACEIFDDGIPSKRVRKEFNAMYPDAKDVEWDREGEYWSVSFETGPYNNRIDHEAYYDRNGNWKRTETDVYLSSVPQNIKDALKTSAEYGSGSFADNDAEYYQTPTGNFYRFEILLGGSKLKVDVTDKGVVKPAGYDGF